MEENMEIGKMHLEVMKDYHQRFGINCMQTMAAILVAIGWLITIDSPSNKLLIGSGFKTISSVVVIVIWIIHISVSYGIKRVLRKQSQEIESLKIVSKNLYSVYEVHNLYFFLNMLMNSMLFGVLLFLIWVNR